MEKGTAMFFCDIAGTITGDENREDNLSQFVESLVKIKESNNIDDFYFVFATADSLQYLQAYKDELSDYIEYDLIKFGKQIFEYKSNDLNGSEHLVTKIDQMFNQIKESKPDYIYYAEDTPTNRLIAQGIASKINCNLITFSPCGEVYSDFGGNSKGLPGLNEAVSKYLKTINKVL